MSKYVEVFQALEKELEKPPILDGDVLLVRILDFGEIKTKSGLIATTGASLQNNSLNATQPIFAEVLKTGKGFYDDGKDIPLEAKPGDVITVGQNAAPVMLRYGNFFNEGLKTAYVRSSEIIERWPDGTFEAYFSALSDRFSK
jgi:hypothetical protein